MGGRRQYTGFIDGESACLQVAQERGALPRHVLQSSSDGRQSGTEKYGGRHEHSFLPEHGRVRKQEKICMSQMRKDTSLSGYGILQELSGHVLYIHRIRKSIERHVGGIQGKEISVLPLQEGTSRTGVQTVPANRKVVHLLKSQYHGKINGSLQHLLPLR